MKEGFSSPLGKRYSIFAMLWSKGRQELPFGNKESIAGASARYTRI